MKWIGEKRQVDKVKVQTQKTKNHQDILGGKGDAGHGVSSCVFRLPKRHSTGFVSCSFFRVSFGLGPNSDSGGSQALPWEACDGTPSHVQLAHFARLRHSFTSCAVLIARHLCKYPIRSINPNNSIFQAVSKPSNNLSHLHVSFVLCSSLLDFFLVRSTVVYFLFWPDVVCSILSDLSFHCCDCKNNLIFFVY